MTALPKVTTFLVGGWLATALASTDPDIDAGVEAYDAEDYEAALERFDAAKERLGERPEVAFDRGLALLRLDKLDEARGAFERATEADDDALRASAHYELGNLEFDAEAYDAAIPRYIDALKANPLHANAKWNLELALLKKKEQEEQEEEEEQEDEEQDEEQEGDENEEQDEDQEGEENEEQEGEQDEEQEGEQDEEQEGEQDEEQEGEQEQPQEDEEQEGEQEQLEEDEEKEGEQPEPEPESDEQPEPAEPKPVDRMDMKRALEALDEQDPFTLDKPQGGYVQPEKDW